MTLPVRLGVCILPTSRWADSRSTWMDLDIAGIDHLWTYDHLSWRDLRDGPWFGAMPLLTAIASVTSNALVGPMVASPNFRHPVPFAKEALTVADISDGRFVCGIGAGGMGWDATVLGAPAWPRAERTARFEEFTSLLHSLLASASTTRMGTYYSANEAMMLPVPPSPVPLAIAATGPRGMDLVARFGEWWITFGDPVRTGELSDQECLAAVVSQGALLDVACTAASRDPSSLRRLLLAGSTSEPWLASVDSFVDLAHRYAAVGITDVVIHAPRTEPPHVADPLVFDHVLGLIS